MKIFDLDGPFQKYGTILFDVLVINLLWFVLSFFTVGILSGPALTGAYAGLYSGIITGEGYTFKQFFRRFKRRFLPSLFFGIFSSLFIGISLFNIYMILMNQFGAIWLLPVYAFILFELSFVTTYVYPLLAHSNLSIRNTLKTAFFLSNKHLPTTVLAVTLNAIVIAIVVLVFAFGYINLFLYLFFIGGVVSSANSYLISKKILMQYDFFIGVDD